MLLLYLFLNKKNQKGENLPQKEEKKKEAQDMEMQRLTSEQQNTVFTPEDLQQYDGKQRKEIYIACLGSVYDVTCCKLYHEGERY
jgi:hypothetical protein